MSRRKQVWPAGVESIMRMIDIQLWRRNKTPTGWTFWAGWRRECLERLDALIVHVNVRDESLRKKDTEIQALHDIVRDLYEERGNLKKIISTIEKGEK